MSNDAELIRVCARREDAREVVHTVHGNKYNPELRQLVTLRGNEQTDGATGERRIDLTGGFFWTYPNDPLVVMRAGYFDLPVPPLPSQYAPYKIAFTQPPVHVLATPIRHPGDPQNPVVLSSRVELTPLSDLSLEESEEALSWPLDTNSGLEHPLPDGFFTHEGSRIDKTLPADFLNLSLVFRTFSLSGDVIGAVDFCWQLTGNIRLVTKRLIWPQP